MPLPLPPRAASSTCKSTKIPCPICDFCPLCPRPVPKSKPAMKFLALHTTLISRFFLLVKIVSSSLGFPTIGQRIAFSSYEATGKIPQGIVDCVDYLKMRREGKHKLPLKPSMASTSTAACCTCGKGRKRRLSEVSDQESWSDNLKVQLLTLYKCSQFFKAPCINFSEHHLKVQVRQSKVTSMKQEFSGYLHVLPYFPLQYVCSKLLVIFVMFANMHH